MPGKSGTHQSPLGLNCPALVLALMVALLSPQKLCVLAQGFPSPPKTRTIHVREILHGIEVDDPYRWLEDGNSPETRAWVEAQNNYTQTLLSAFPDKETIRKRLTALSRVQDFSLPIERNGRFFFSMRYSDQELPSIFFKKGPTARPEILVDPGKLSENSSISVSLLDVSPDGSLLAYGSRSGGRDEMEVNLLNVNSGEGLPDRLPQARYYGVSLSGSNRSFHYARLTSEGPRVYVHTIGKDPSEDQEVFGKGYGPDKIIAPSLSDDGRYLLLTVSHGSPGNKTELYLQDLSNGGPITSIVNDIPARFQGEIAGSQLFLHTNWQAPKGRILAVDLKNPAREQWKEIVPATNVIIQGFALADGKLFINCLDNVAPQIRILTPEGKRIRDLKAPDLGTISEIHGRWSSHHAFYSFTSFHIPRLIFRYEVSTGDHFQWGKINVPINMDQFTVRQVWYESEDKTRVPMFLMTSPNQILDGNNPTLLTGYGGFNQSVTPSFSPLAVVWVENGGVFALPNLRGGGEFGEEWHQSGMLEKKQNVFDDFVAAAQWLIKRGYTQPSRLALAGGSNGGLLVGAAMTQRPDLFRAVICRYPLLDMLRYHKFLAGQYWISEYGSADDPVQFKTLLSYSPYHQVKPGKNYPAVMLVSGDADTRVDPLHARKMTALLQATESPQRPTLLRYDRQAGHVAGARPVSQVIDDVLAELSFLFLQLGERFGK